MKLLYRLENCFISLHNPTPQAVQSCLESLDITLYDVLPYLEFPGSKPYGRRLLYQSSQMECLAMNWASYGKCNIHNHGMSWGLVQVVTGTVVNTIYDDFLKPIETNTETTGNIFFAPKGLVHQMENRTNQQLVTFHIYCPPISGMKVYDLQNRREITVTDDCGAWIPEKNQIVNSRKLEPKSNYCFI